MNAIPPRSIRLLAACLLLCVLASGKAFAQPSHEVRVSTEEPYVGQPFTLDIVIQNAGKYSQPEFPSLSDCTVRGIPGSSFTQIINGRMSQSVTLTYEITPHKPGKLIIPPIPFNIDGHQVTTQQLQLRVRDTSELPKVAEDAGGVPLLLAEVQCRDKKLYVGQKARFTLTIWIRPAQTNRGDAVSADSMFGQLDGSRTGFGPFSPDPSVADRRLPLKDGSQAHYYEYTLRTDVVVDQPGPVNLNDLTISMDYPLGISRDLFGGLRASRMKSVRIRPDIVAPDVQPLPTDGQPVGFTGAVGELAISVRSDETDVHVGDPITLTVDITGDGPLDILRMPALVDQPAFAASFDIPDENLNGTFLRDRKRFTPVIRAKRADVTEIPAVEFAYFNPHSERYETARSRPIPIKVRAAEKLSAEEVIDLPGAQTSPGGEVQALDGLRGNKTSEIELLTAARPVTETQVAIITFAPPAAFVGMWALGAVSRRNGDTLRRRRQNAADNALKRIRSAADSPPIDQTREIESSLAVYLADRLNEPPARFTGRTAIEYLRERGIDGDTLTKCIQVVARCEQAAYAGMQPGDVDLVEQARDCISRLERERL